MKRAAALLIALGVAAVTLLASAPPAAAVDLLGCTDAPTPEVPGRGVTGFFESAPKVPPPAEDPFVDGSRTSIYQQYGYAGLRWNTYDLGCGPDLARAPDATIGTAVANWIMLMPKAAVAVTGATLGAAFDPGFLSVLDPVIGRVVVALKVGLFDQWYWAPLLALGLLMIWRARKQRLAESAQAIGWALLVMVLVTAVFRWPLVAGHAADESVTAVLGGTNAALAGKPIGDQAGAAAESTAGMHEALLYEAWLGGTFGSTDSAVAKKYGPIIFDATALTWSQAKTLQDDPEAGRAIIEAKKSKFEDAAGKIKEADPDAYDYLTGRRSDTRVGYALLAGLATLCAVPFLLIAGLLVLGALIIVRFGVMLFPGFATLGLFPTMRALVTGIGSTIAAALINALAFGVGAGVFVMVAGTFLASPITPWLKVVLLLLMTVVFWLGMRPFRRLTQMASGQQVFAGVVGAPAEAARAAGRAGIKLLGAAITGGAAGLAAGKVIEDEVREQPVQRAEAQPDAYPVTIHPPAIQAAPEPAPPPVIIHASTRDLPAPQQAITARSEASLEAPAPTSPADLPPVRVEAAEAGDWDTAYRAELAPEETR